MTSYVASYFVTAEAAAEADIDDSIKRKRFRVSLDNNIWYRTFNATVPSMASLLKSPLADITTADYRHHEI